MPSHLIIDKNDPAVADSVANCEEGKPETLTITGTPIKVDENTVVFAVDSSTYAGEEAAPAEEEPVEEEAAPAEAPYKPKAVKAAAVY